MNPRDSEFARAQRLLAHDTEAHASEAVVPAIAQTSLFTFASYAEMADTFAGHRTRNVYSRTTNPTVTMFEQKMAALEHAEEAIGFPSGMAAISAAVLAFVQPQDRIVCVRHVYPDAYRFFETLLKKLGVSVAYVDAPICTRLMPRCRAPNCCTSRVRRAGPCRRSTWALWRRSRAGTALLA